MPIRPENKKRYPLFSNGTEFMTWLSTPCRVPVWLASTPTSVGIEVLSPTGISRYPHNALWGILRFVSYIILCAWGIMLSLWSEEY